MTETCQGETKYISYIYKAEIVLDLLPSFSGNKHND